MAPSALVVVRGGTADAPDGVSASELLDLRGTRSALTASQLESWLLEHGFAELIDEHELVPTPLAIEIACDLRFLDG